MIPSAWIKLIFQVAPHRFPTPMGLLPFSYCTNKVKLSVSNVNRFRLINDPSLASHWNKLLLESAALCSISRGGIQDISPEEL